jgi:glycosyltransferase involved in cell wall biosynthesis
MVVLEAMAFGKSVIGSRIGGIPEQIEDGKSGYLFEMGNTEKLAEKMIDLILNPALRITMGMAARQKLETSYSLARHNEDLLKMYNNLLE